MICCLFVCLFVFFCIRLFFVLYSRRVFTSAHQRCMGPRIWGSLSLRRMGPRIWGSLSVGGVGAL